VKVSVVLLGMHRAFLPPGAALAGRVTLEFAEDAVTLSRVREALGMPADAPRIVFLHGQPMEDETVVHDAETVTFVSPIGGG
jgi:hypothetical protein